jgi:hypothetical protein
MPNPSVVSEPAAGHVQAKPAKSDRRKSLPGEGAWGGER